MLKTNYTPMPMGYVYALVDPITGRFRYIGKTSNTLKQRRRGHMLSARNAMRKHQADPSSVSPLYRWLCSLDKPPKIIPLHARLHGADLASCEALEIARAFRRGDPILNAAIPAATLEAVQVQDLGESSRTFWPTDMQIRQALARERLSNGRVP